MESWGGEQRYKKHSIQFPPTHELCILRNLWLGEEGNELSIDLDPVDEVGIHVTPPVGNLSAEIERLQILLTGAAWRRMRELGGILTGDKGAQPKRLDEEAFIFVSSDEMAAWLFFLPSVGGGKELTLTQLQQLFVVRGVTSGVDWELLKRISECEQRYFRLFTIACGVPSLRGNDGRTEDRFPRELTPNVLEDKADYETLKLVQKIDKGAIICEFVPPEPGEDGYTVTGRTLKAKPGAEAEIPQGRNTRLSDDRKYLLAEQSGHLVFSGKSFHVKPVLDIQGGDEIEGHSVKFIGDIHIHGDIRSGISISAIGNIQVDGVVEGCTIEAGENIIVSNGVQGQGSAVLHAQKSVYAKYLENCEVYARQSVQADCIINCNVYCNGIIRVCTGRGAVIGGNLCASREVFANTVGSKAERQTLIVIGGLPCEEAERRQILKEIEEIQRKIEGLQRLGDDPSVEAKLSKLRLNQYVAKMKIEIFDKDLANMLPYDGDCRLRCATAYPGTTVTIGHDSLRISSVEQNCNIGVVDGFVGQI